MSRIVNLTLASALGLALTIVTIGCSETKAPEKPKSDAQNPDMLKNKKAMVDKGFEKAKAEHQGDANKDKKEEKKEDKKEDKKDKN